MPDNDAGEKSEMPTPRKVENARKEGQVAMSTEVNTAGLLLVGFVALIFLGPSFWQAVSGLVTISVTDALTWELTDGPSLMALLSRYQGMLSVMAGFCALMFVAAMALGMAQVGIFFTGKPLVPQWSRISPLSGLKRLFGLRGLMRFVFSLLKLVIIVVVAWLVVEYEVAGRMAFSLDLQAKYTDTVWMLILLAIKLAALLALIAALDYMYQRFQHQRDLMMTKQEVKDEMKQAEGDPLVKSRIRQVQRQMAQNRMMQEVPNADVVITNPTHVAVAIKYDQKTMNAPIVVAKGYDLIAQRIKSVASEHNIVQVENVPLARALAKEVDLGQAIPVDFYQQIAEILSYVYKLKKKAG